MTMLSVLRAGVDRGLCLLRVAVLGTLTSAAPALAMPSAADAPPPTAPAHDNPAAPQPEPANGPARFDGLVVVRVHPRSIRDLRTAATLSGDIWSCGVGDPETLRGVGVGNPVDFRFSPEAFAAFKDAQIPYDMLIPDVQALIDRERAEIQGQALRGPGTWFDSYKDYAAVSTYTDTLIALRPDLASRVPVGTTPQGRAIWAIRIGAPGAAPGTRPAIVTIHAQHAREWITVMAGMYLADRLVRTYDTDATVRRLLGSFEFYIIPIVNADGYVYTWTTNRLWRKNRVTNSDGTAGVDLNRNYGYQWGGQGASTIPSNDTYRGTSAFSEVESRAVRDFVLARSSTALFLDVHSYSQLVLEPWAYDWPMPKDNRAFQQLSGVMQTAMYASAGTVFYAGETYRVIYPASGGSHDWAYGAANIPALSFELRDTGQNGFVLPAAQIVPASIECSDAVLAGAAWLIDNAASVSFPLGQPAWVNAGGSTTVTVQFARGRLALADLTSSTPTVSWRAGRTAPFTTTPLTNTGTFEAGPVFTHALTAGVCGSVVQWYYTLPLAGGGTITVPPAGGAAPYEADARSATTIFADDFEADRGWTYGVATDTATSANAGLWTRADPAGTAQQSEYDVTPGVGVNCAITAQNARGNNSLAAVSGTTTLLSPLLNLAGRTDPTLSLWVWFNNQRQRSSTDPLAIDVSNNNGLTWIRAITIAANAEPALTTGRWNRFEVKIAPLIGLSANTRVRVVAASSVSGVLTEVAIDEVRVVDFTCQKPPCPADADGDGTVDVPDIFTFLSAWFANAPSADADASGQVEVADIFVFLSRWFARCP